MAISFPRAMPTHVEPRNVTLRAVNAVGISASPFTGQQQSHAYPAQAWQMEIGLPPMRRADAEIWIAWLVSLRGRYGTFLAGDRFTPPRGSAADTPGDPRVAGGSQTGATLSIDGLPASATGYLKAGDMIQLGSGADARLHKVLEDVDSDGDGAADLEIWPSLRSAPADNVALTVSGAKGVFRLASNETEWSVSELALYGVTFAAIEALT
jgi:hypothetical protein